MDRADDIVPPGSTLTFDGRFEIGAGWGYHDAEELLGAGAIVVADRPSDVLSLVRERIDA